MAFLSGILFQSRLKITAKVFPTVAEVKEPYHTLLQNTNSCAIYRTSRGRIPSLAHLCLYTPHGSYMSRQEHGRRRLSISCGTGAAHRHRSVRDGVANHTRWRIAQGQHLYRCCIVDLEVDVDRAYRQIAIEDMGKLDAGR